MCCTLKSAAWVEHGLLDDLIRPQQERLRDRQAERLGGSEIYDQLELGRLLNGEVSGLGALEDLVHVSRGPSEQIVE